MILTLEASEIATHGGDGERARSGKDVKERLLFDRVHVQGDRTAINESVKLAFPVLPYSTDSPFGRGDDASVVAKGALHLPILKGTVKHGFLHILLPIPRGNMS